MPMSVGVGGANRRVAAMWVGVGGAWRLVSRADTGVGGAWRLGFSSITLDPTYSVISLTTAGFRLGADGLIYRITQSGTSSPGQWGAPGIDGSAYTVTSTLLSGQVASGTIGSADLSADRTWTCNSTEQNAQIGLSITPTGSPATVLDSTVVTLAFTT